MQAARGASLTSSDAGSPESDHQRPRPAAAPARTVFVLVALAAYAVDVASKVWAVERLADGDIEVLGDWFRLHLVRNPGAAFSTGTEFTVVFSLVAIAAVCVVLWFGRRVGNVVWAVALGLLLAGIGGNLTDRLLREPGPLRGHVVDMFAVPHWPVFNVADICIDVAAGLILLQAFRNVRLDGTKPTRVGSDDEAGNGWGMTTVDHRVLMVPDGLAGERLDAAMARLFGLSRTRAADLISEGHVSIDGAAVAKSDRLVPGTMLEVAIPSQADPLEVGARDRRGHQDRPRRRVDRGDRQARRRRGPPLARLVGPDGRRSPDRRRLPDRHQRRVGAAGHRPAPGRRHLGGDGDLQGRARLLGAQERLPPPQRSTRSTTRSCRATPIRSRAPSTPRSAGTPGPTTSTP